MVMSSLLYGSDNPDSIKMEGTEFHSPTMQKSGSKWKKVLLAMAGIVLSVSSVVAMYQGWSSYLPHHDYMSVTSSEPPGMLLESKYASKVKPDTDLLKTGEEIMLQVRGKNNLCLDDGGGWTAGVTKFTNKPCNPSNPNQVFTYNPTTREFASVYKQGMCIDDGGALAAGGSKFHLWGCDPKNKNQWFVMDPKTQTLNNPSKNNLCVDDGGGVTAGSSKYMLMSCDNKNPNQHFNVLSRAAMAKEKKANLGTTMYDLMVTGKEIMFRVRGKSNLCMDDGGSFNIGVTKFVNMPCNPNSVNQVFRYNTKTGGFESANKPGLCIDDGGSPKAAGSNAHLWNCDINNQNQWFEMDESTMMLRNPVKELCYDDGGGVTAASSKYVMWHCDNNNPNQHFDVLSQDVMLEEKKKTGLTPYDILSSGQEVMLRVRGKNNLCVDDGGGWGAAVTKFVDKSCNPKSPNQVFKYDIRTLEFQSVSKPGLCIDDGGADKAAGSNAHLWYCDANNRNQWFVLDESTLMLRNPMKENLCLDDGGGKTAGATMFVLWNCDNSNPNQHFEIVPRSVMRAEMKTAPGGTAYDVLTSGQEVMLRVRGKKNLCVDDGGGWASGVTKFVNRPCDGDSPNQVYKYNVNTREFENVNKPGLCIDDGGSWEAAGTQAHLWYCDPNNQNQWLVFDEETLMLHNPMKKGLCFDDGGGTASGATRYVLWHCDNNNPNQHFEILPRATFIEERRKKRIAAGINDDIELLNSGQKIMLRVRGKNNLCVDDGGGRSNGATKFVDQPCDPSNSNQVFTYDAKTRQFRSVSKPNLCMDDGGAVNAAGSQAHLWDCDPNNQNQWFVLDEDMMMLRNPIKDLCLDDGGGTKPGESRYVLWHCSNDNPNQHFEILSYSKMMEERKKRFTAAGLDDEVGLLNSGAPIMLRVRGKKNLCVDDGGGRSNGASKFVDMPCDASSSNQLFAYDASNRLFRSVNKPHLCIDDGGAMNAGATTAHLWNCDPNNPNQWFVWDDETMMLRNPAKRNLCFDDGGGMTPGQTKYWLWDCDVSNPNQHFEVMTSAAIADERIKARIASGNSAMDILASGQEVMLRVRGKNLCVDDGGGHKNGETKFVDQQCNPDSPNQIFNYDSMTHQFRSVTKLGMCIDDGGAWNAGGSQVHLWECDPNNQNQWFVLDEDTLMLHSTVKDNVCLDDGGGTSAGATRFVMWHCSNDNPNQHFEVLPRAVMTEMKRKRLIAAGVDDDVDLLRSGQQLMIRVRGKNNLCVDDGGGHSNGETKFVDMPCDPSSPNQLFTYDWKTHQFRSVNKPALCIDDGGGWSAAQTTAHLWDCDENNQNQWFILDEDNMMLRNPVKPNLCFDDGGGLSPGATKFWLWGCDANNPNQHFEFMSPASMPMLPGLRNPNELGRKYLDLLQTGVQVLIRSHTSNMCLDDGGGFSSGETKFVFRPCDPNSANQAFSYDVKSREFRSTNKPGLCLDDGGGWDIGTTTAHLWVCDPGNMNQWFQYDPATLLLHNPAKPGMCLNNEGDMIPGVSKFNLWDCYERSPNQQFEILSRGAMQGGPDIFPPPHTIEQILLPDIDHGCDHNPPTPFMQRPEPVYSDVNTNKKESVNVIPTTPTVSTLPDQLVGNVPPQDVPIVQTPVADQFSNPVVNTNVKESDKTKASTFSDISPDKLADRMDDKMQPTDVSVPVTDHLANPETSTAVNKVEDVVPVESRSDILLDHREMPSPDVPLVKKADAPLVEYSNGDWNLLAPSNDTIEIVNADKSSTISAAEIFQYLQRLKDQADMKHEVVMYRCRRTYECVSAGLQTLAKDALSADQYHVLVQWMYDHCDTGATNTAPAVNPSPPLSGDQLKSDDVAPLVDDTSVKRQFMTKLDFYYEIKNHFAQKNAEFVGDAGVANLRSEQTLSLEKKLIDCINEASKRYNQAGTSADLKDAISWVETTCVAS